VAQADPIFAGGAESGWFHGWAFRYDASTYAAIKFEGRFRQRVSDQPLTNGGVRADLLHLLAADGTRDPTPQRLAGGGSLPQRVPGTSRAQAAGEVAVVVPRRRRCRQPDPCRFAPITLGDRSSGPEAPASRSSFARRSSRARRRAEDDLPDDEAQFRSTGFAKVFRADGCGAEIVY